MHNTSDNLKKKVSSRDPLLWNKIFASIALSVLVVTIMRELTFHIYPSVHFYHTLEPAYSNVTEEESAVNTVDPQKELLEKALASLSEGDAKKGALVFKRCQSCHTVSNKNASGPFLNNLFGRKQGSVKNFKYSRAMSNIDKKWTKEEFAEYIINPKKYLPGTVMSFAGLKTFKDIINLIAFLETQT